MKSLTLEGLKAEAREFANRLRQTPLPELYGITDGKAVGTYVELQFHEHLRARYAYAPGNAATGVDIPELQVDIKCTSARQPQSSSPYRSASQKVYGLGHSLLVFVYIKADDHDARAARRDMQHVVYVPSELTADYQTTYGLAEILRRDGNKDDVTAFLEERNLPLDDVGRDELAERIVNDPPAQGYLTISNALQWRLQFGRVIQRAVSGDAEGLEDILA